MPLSDLPQLDQLAWVWPLRGQPLWRSPWRTSHSAGEKKLPHIPEIFRVLGRSWTWSNRELWTGTAWWRSIRWPRGYSASMRWKFEDDNQNKFFPRHCTCLLFLILEIWGVKWCSFSDARKLQLRNHPWQANGIQPCGHRRFFASFIFCIYLFSQITLASIDFLKAKTSGRATRPWRWPWRGSWWGRTPCLCSRGTRGMSLKKKSLLGQTKRFLFFAFCSHYACIRLRPYLFYKDVKNPTKSF